MARQTSKLIQGSQAAANFYAMSPWLDYSRVSADGHAPNYAAMNIVGGFSYDGTRYNVPFKEVLVGVRHEGGGLFDILLSADYGRTWRFWFNAGPDYSTATFEAQIHAAGRSANNSGEILIGYGTSGVMGLGNIDTIFTSPPNPNSTEHNTGNGFPATMASPDNNTMRCAWDYVNNRWWVVGIAGGGTGHVAWKSTSVLATGGWSSGAATGFVGLRNIAFGLGPTLSGEAIVTSDNAAGHYCYIDAATPSAGTEIDLTGATSMVMNGFVYNDYWQQWLFVDNVRGEGTCAVMRCPYTSIGSTNTADYEFITTYSNPPGSAVLIANDAAVTVDIEGKQGTIGPWCWFQATNHQVIATPDMGNTWYVQQYVSQDSPAVIIPAFSATQALGCIILNSWNQTTDVFYSAKSAPLRAFSPFANR